jgi:hypothetical protein
LGRANFLGAGGDDNLSIKFNWPYKMHIMLILINDFYHFNLWAMWYLFEEFELVSWNIWIVVEEIAFIGISISGEVRYSKNNTKVATLMHVDKTLPLWLFFDVYGNIQKIRSVGKYIGFWWQSTIVIAAYTIFMDSEYCTKI